MQEYKLKVYIYTLKSAKSATPTLIHPLTPYHSPYYNLHKYTEAKNLLKYRKLTTEQKFSCSLLSLYMKTKTR